MTANEAAKACMERVAKCLDEFYAVTSPEMAAIEQDFTEIISQVTPPKPKPARMHLQRDDASAVAVCGYVFGRALNNACQSMTNVFAAVNCDACRRIYYGEPPAPRDEINERVNDSLAMREQIRQIQVGPLVAPTPEYDEPLNRAGDVCPHCSRGPEADHRSGGCVYALFETLRVKNGTRVDKLMSTSFHEEVLRRKNIALAQLDQTCGRFPQEIEEPPSRRTCWEMIRGWFV